MNADATFPSEVNSVDMIWSNLAFYPSRNFDYVLNVWRDVMQPDALLTLSCFGPETLRELCDTFSSENLHEKPLQFEDIDRKSVV